MASLTAGAREWLTQHHQAVLITLRGDGSAQSSNVLTAFDGDVFRVSVTAGRAKTRTSPATPVRSCTCSAATSGAMRPSRVRHASAP